MNGQALTIGTVVRFDWPTGPAVGDHSLTDEYGRIAGEATDVAGTIFPVRFPALRWNKNHGMPRPAGYGTDVVSVHRDYLAVVTYVRAEYLSPDDAGHGARIRVRERYVPRRQRTMPYPHEHGGMFGDNAKPYCVGEFARTVLGMLRPDVREAYARGRATMYAVTDSGECTCTDEYGPCEFHGDTIVVREGASSRTADDLRHTFLTDVVSVIGEWPSDEYREATTRIGNALADNERHGVRWLPDDSPDDNYPLSDELGDLTTTAEGHLASAGYSVFWEDGYRIVRVTGGPLTDDGQ